MNERKNKYGKNIYKTTAEEEESESYIGDNVKIKGNLKSSKKIVISGKITGNIFSDTGTTIEKHGNVNGKIESKSIDVFGKVNGKLRSDGKITIHPLGKFTGDLNSKTIIVKEGAVFNGTANTEED